MFLARHITSKPQATKVVRDRVKAQKFYEVFDTLPLPIRDMYQATSSLGRGMKRERQTEIINAALKKVNGRYEVDVGNALFSYSKTREKREKAKLSTQGDIREVAETKMGGPVKLDNAVNRGAVKVIVCLRFTCFHGLSLDN